MKILLYVLLAFGVFCFFSCKRIEKEQLTFLMKEGDDTLYFVNLPSTVLLYAREEKSADSPMVNW